MTHKKTPYQAPDIEIENMSILSVLCESADTEDYGVISDFEW